MAYFRSDRGARDTARRHRPRAGTVFPVCVIPGTSVPPARLVGPGAGPGAGPGNASPTASQTTRQLATQLAGTPKQTRDRQHVLALFPAVTALRGRHAFMCSCMFLVASASQSPRSTHDVCPRHHERREMGGCVLDGCVPSMRRFVEARPGSTAAPPTFQTVHDRTPASCTNVWARHWRLPAQFQCRGQSHYCIRFTTNTLIYSGLVLPRTQRLLLCVRFYSSWPLIQQCGTSYMAAQHSSLLKRCHDAVIDIMQARRCSICCLVSRKPTPQAGVIWQESTSAPVYHVQRGPASYQSTSLSNTELVIISVDNKAYNVHVEAEGAGGDNGAAGVH